MDVLGYVVLVIPGRSKQMSFWSFMNIVAWGLSAYLFVIIAWDFIRVEKAAHLKNKQNRI